MGLKTMEVADALSGHHRPRTVLNLPPGYHFAPTDEELVVHYLRRQIASLPPLLPIFKDVASLVNHRPEQITEKFKDCGDDRWYFFTKRSRKYARGNRPNRTTSGNGFWKATGPQRMIYSGKREKRMLVGRVRTLVFYSRPNETDDNDEKAALSECKTSWTMYEYENLTSKTEAADKNVDKLDEWVLCTIQKQKEKTDGNETSPGVPKKVKGTKVMKERIKVVASKKKKKGKQEKIESEDETDQGSVQDIIRPMKRSKVPMRPSHLEMAAPEEGDEMGMFGFEYNSCPKEGSPVPTKHESPYSETMSPCVMDNNYYDPNMAPTPCLQEQPYSEMMSACAGGDYNIIGSTVSSNIMSWQGSPFPEMMVRSTHPVGNTNSFSPPMEMVEYETSPFIGYNYHNVAPNLVTHQPATSYFYPHSAAAQLGAYGYAGATQNMAGCHSSYGYTKGEFVPMLMNSGELSSQSLGVCSADSSQYNGGPSVLGPG